LELIKRYRLFSSVKQEWIYAFSVKGFIRKLIFFIAFGLVLLTFLRYYFQYLEVRNGSVLNDWLLDKLSPKNFSWNIFGLLYLSISVGFLYLFTKPFILIRALETAAIVYSIRIITLYLVKLDPPAGIIPLVDPIANYFGFGGTLITKDLFFSGHTTSILILFLAVKIPSLKMYFLIALIAIVVMLLWQHVHYSVDIIGALFFTIAAWKITGRHLKQ